MRLSAGRTTGAEDCQWATPLAGPSAAVPAHHLCQPGRPSRSALTWHRNPQEPNLDISRRAVQVSAVTIDRMERRASCADPTSQHGFETRKRASLVQRVSARGRKKSRSRCQRQISIIKCRDFLVSGRQEVAELGIRGITPLFGHAAAFAALAWRLMPSLSLLFLSGRRRDGEFSHDGKVS